MTNDVLGMAGWVAEVQAQTNLISPDSSQADHGLL